MDKQKARGRIVDFDREVQVGDGKQRVDFRLAIATDMVTSYAWIEVKHWLIGHQKGAWHDALFCFGDLSSVGIRPDVEKLMKIKEGSKYLLILTAANPGEKDWSSGVAKFNERFSPLSLEPLTNPADFPRAYYLGLLEVDGC